MIKKNKPSNKTAAKAKLAAGAKKIRAAEAAAKKKKKGDAPPPPPQVIELLELTRSADEIVRDRVTVLPGSIGLALHEDTTIEEALAIFDYTQTLQDHVGFMVGDVLNFSEAKFGEKYSLAMSQTGRANSTLKGYAEVARHIPPDQRVQALSFSAHREVVRLSNPETRVKMLTDLNAAAEKGELPTTKEIRYKVQRMQPPKARKPKKAPTSGKGKKGGRVIEPYRPTDEEQAKIDTAEEAINEARDLIGDKAMVNALLKGDNKTKKRWTAMLAPFVSLDTQIAKHTGY